MKKILNTDQAPDPIGPYNQAVAYNGVLYVSGQIAKNPHTGKLVIDNIKAETVQVMENLKAILKNAGISFEDVLKCSVFVSDMGNYDEINKVYATYFNDKTAPARELVEVAKLPKNVNLEISLLAAI